jgi:hypothetical protein
MKKQSKLHPEVVYVRWKTPLSNGGKIKLESTLRTSRYIHFFFTLEKEEYKKIYVMSASNRTFRVLDPAAGKISVGKYFDGNGDKKGKTTMSPTYPTWKLWETNLINELDANLELCCFTPESHKDICEYLVITEDEWIEIIDSKPDWRSYSDIEIGKLLEHYVKKKFYE